MAQLGSVMWSERDQSINQKRKQRPAQPLKLSLCGKFFTHPKNKSSVYLHHITHIGALDTRPHDLFLLLLQFCLKRLIQTGSQGVCLRLTVQPRLALICVVSQQASRDHSTTDRMGGIETSSCPPSSLIMSWAANSKGIPRTGQTGSHHKKAVQIWRGHYTFIKWQRVCPVLVSAAARLHVYYCWHSPWQSETLTRISSICPVPTGLLSLCVMH